MVVADDGVTMGEAVLGLAGYYGVPVWVTPAGATVDVSGNRLIARDRETGAFVRWIQIMPSGEPAPELPWYDTRSGMFETRQDAVIELRPGPGGRASGMLAVPHSEYYASLAEARLMRVLDGMYAAQVDIDPLSGTFAVYGDARRPLRELPEILGRHGWTAGQAIVVLPRYTSFDEQNWDTVAGAYAAIADEAGVSVYFPGWWSHASWWSWDVRSGNTEPAVVASPGAPGDAGGPRWERRDPSAEGWRPPHPVFVPDPAGRLRDERNTGFAFLVMSSQVRTSMTRLQAGVASPTAEMMAARGLAYQQAGSDPERAFLVDVPRAADGGIALAYPGGGIARASTAEVLELLKRGGHVRELQALRFPAPETTETPEQYDMFVEDVQRVANELGRHVDVAQPRLAVRVLAGQRGVPAGAPPGPPGRPVAADPPAVATGPAAG